MMKRKMKKKGDEEEVLLRKMKKNKIKRIKNTSKKFLAGTRGP